MAPPEPARSWLRRRRWLVVASAVAIALIVAVAALPTALSTPPARRWLLARANRALAPGSIAANALRFSWFGPTTATALVLRDQRGEVLIDADLARLGRSFAGLLLDRPRYGTLILTGARVEVDWRRDGGINLVETLRPIIRRDPETQITIRIVGGPLQIRAPRFLAAPIEAETSDFQLKVEPAPAAVTWHLLATNDRGSATEAETLEVGGSLDRWKHGPEVPPDLALDVKADRWPLSIDLAGVSAEARLEGEIDLGRRETLWSASGSIEARELTADAPALAGDRIQLDGLTAVVSAEQTPAAWKVDRIAIQSSFLTLEGAGTWPATPGVDSHLEGRLDLAGLARQIPRALRLRDGLAIERGEATLRIDGQAKDGREGWSVVAEVAELVGANGGRSFAIDEPAEFRAELVREGGTARLESVGLRTAFLDASARGGLRDGLSLEGSIDLGPIPDLLGDLVDLGGLELSGRGPISGHYRRDGGSYSAGLDVGLQDLRVAGIGPSTIDRAAVRLKGAVSGASVEDGLPRGWASAEIALTSGDASAGLTMANRDGGTDLAATVGLIVDIADRPRRAEAHASGRWGSPVVAIDRARLALRPIDEGDTSSPLVLEGRGRYDREADLLRIEPTASPGSSRAATLGPDGIQVQGLGGQGEGIRAEADLLGDLAAIASDFGLATDLAGSWSARLLARRSEAGGLDLGARVDLDDVSWPTGDGKARRSIATLGLAARGLTSAEGDRIDLPEVVLASPYATLEASGVVHDLKGNKGFELLGKLSPDWSSINESLADRLASGVRVRGEARPFRLAGSLGGEGGPTFRDRIEAEVGVDLIEADLFGMVVGPTPVVVRAKGGSLAMDPIATSINRGTIRLEPTIDLGDDTRGVSIRLGPGSAIRGAEINPEVSRRVLSFVAPVLQGATQVTGSVSVQVDRAEFPIGPPDDRGTTVEGEVTFRDVEFAPGGLGRDLVSLVGLSDLARLRIDQPVALEVSNGRVIQRGLAIPIGTITQVELAGVIDFQSNLSLVAELPITRAMAGNLPVLADVVGGTRISVPIRGTLSEPKLDRDAFNASLKALGTDLLGRSAIRGAAGILNLIDRARERKRERRQGRDEEP